MSTTTMDEGLGIDKTLHLIDKPGTFDPWLLTIYAKMAKFGLAFALSMAVHSPFHVSLQKLDNGKTATIVGRPWKARTRQR